VADFAVQALAAYRLGVAFPDDPLVAEEDASPLRFPQAEPILRSIRDTLGTTAPDVPADRIVEAIERGGGAPAERFWTLDPIDGTRGFLRGDQYVVALALIAGGRVEIGVLGCPRLTLGDGGHAAAGSIAWAVRNGGAFYAPLSGGPVGPLRVSSCSEPRLARVLRSFESAHIDAAAFDAIVRKLEVQAPPILMDSQAKHAVVAAGRADLLIRVPATADYREKIWDHAAGAILIEEAGGRVTDSLGRALDFGGGRTLGNSRGVVASNGHLHAAVIETLSKASGSGSPPHR
jgi:3'(2'), 5'-bisphosphate nucleotidase